MWHEAAGVVVQGHRVASGQGGDPRFPAGTVALQLPLFAALAPGLERWLGGPPFPGTVNVRLLGMAVAAAAAELVLRDVAWTEAFAPETFRLSRAELVAGGRTWRAWLYEPDPATKPPDHPPRADVAELLAPWVPGLRYGDAVRLRWPAGTLDVALAQGGMMSP